MGTGRNTERENKEKKIKYFTFPIKVIRNLCMLHPFSPQTLKCAHRHKRSEFTSPRVFLGYPDNIISQGLSSGTGSIPG